MTDQQQMLCQSFGPYALHTGVSRSCRACSSLVCNTCQQAVHGNYMLHYISSMPRLAQSTDRSFAAASSVSGSASILTANTTVQGGEEPPQALQGDTLAGAGAANTELAEPPAASRATAAMAAGTEHLNKTAGLNPNAADSQTAVRTTHVCPGRDCTAADGAVTVTYRSSAVDMAALPDVQPPQVLAPVGLEQAAAQLLGSPGNNLATAAAGDAAQTSANGPSAGEHGG
jgi:hypothetical protein